MALSLFLDLLSSLTTCVTAGVGRRATRDGRSGKEYLGSVIKDEFGLAD
jgi:hypothetical protein